MIKCLLTLGSPSALVRHNGLQKARDFFFPQSTRRRAQHCVEDLIEEAKSSAVMLDGVLTGRILPGSYQKRLCWGSHSLCCLPETPSSPPLYRGDLTRPQQEETKHRHILHVCMAHRELLPSHLCGLISLFLSSCVFLFIYSIAAWKCSTCGESLSPAHMQGERTRGGWDWQSQTKCLRSIGSLPFFSLCHNHPNWGAQSTRWGWGSNSEELISFCSYPPHLSLPPPTRTGSQIVSLS